MSLNLKNFKKGFTLIELLIVVSVIGILAGVLTTVIDYDRTKAVARDGVLISTVAKTAEAMEVFAAAEGRVAVTNSADWNPLNGADGSIVASYVGAWPGVDFRYSTPNNTVCVSVPRATEPTEYYKYIGSGTSECSRIVIICSTQCTNNAGSIDFSDCTLLDEVTGC